MRVFTFLRYVHVFCDAYMFFVEGAEGCKPPKILTQKAYLYTVIF